MTRLPPPLLLLFVLVKFTDLAGHDIWVERNAVTAVSEGYGCHDAPTQERHAKINTGSGQYLCVREDAATVVDRLERAK